ncbi:hypothetical protein MNBD_GAMMA18-2054 [hydrothermal vent metagenome]|uniref:Uncharacterized protein n=1 Tax=hydrothermal vent metagenome TaxID=652676 RepID=A0A3B0ZSQ9_9ZZZZ
MNTIEIIRDQQQGRLSYPKVLQRRDKEQARNNLRNYDAETLFPFKRFQEARSGIHL